ncbi:hypothetical protein E1287_10095 [Actinomadura sp. KC06]|uniref:hypothetical protein n=1 Tax=Actinomadura sp. KC06 TaxID=2530369 RepID=UPI0010437152|nr:hypothetical protein [Actinomadura sp. KC06]TDD36861.1 hypothetical protein E1287_10095 [Actinomadura sp. KC06]
MTERQEAADYLFALAELLRGHGYTPEQLGTRRLRVTDGEDSRAVEIECHPRRGDADRWWFTWGGGFWMCEADHPTDALVQVKTALRQVE